MDLLRGYCRIGRLDTTSYIVIRVYANVDSAGGLGVGALLSVGQNPFVTRLIELRITILFWELIFGIQYSKRF